MTQAMMDLTGYLARIGSVIAVQANESLTYPSTILTEGLRQALREYDTWAPPMETVAAVTATGCRQAWPDVAGVTIKEIIAVAWPWEATDQAASGVRLRDRTVRWRVVAPGVIWIEDGEPQAGDYILWYVRREHLVKNLDGATAGTVPVAHEDLLVQGAAAWSVELHYRQAAESVKGPTAEQIKRMYTWSYLRLNEFRTGLKDIARVAPVVRPSWGNIGL